jgi:hypothetical protein
MLLDEEIELTKLNKENSSIFLLIIVHSLGLKDCGSQEAAGRKLPAPVPPPAFYQIDLL